MWVVRKWKFYSNIFTFPSLTVVFMLSLSLSPSPSLRVCVCQWETDCLHSNFGCFTDAPAIAVHCLALFVVKKTCRWNTQTLQNAVTQVMQGWSKHYDNVPQLETTPQSAEWCIFARFWFFFNSEETKLLRTPGTVWGTCSRSECQVQQQDFNM